MQLGGLFQTIILITALVGLSPQGGTPAWAEDHSQQEKIPHLDPRGQEGFLEYGRSESSRAFAIAPGGAWAWVSGYQNAEEAGIAAKKECAQYTYDTCHLYAVDEDVVFDEQAWAASWAPYPDDAEAAAAPVAVGPRKRFPDLALTSPEGKAVTLSDLKGKIVFLHFWGSWCPPCQAEFPELQKLYSSLSTEADIAFVLVQSRESIVKSRQWAKRQGVSLPLYDSGTQGRADRDFQLAGGGTLADRIVAPAFPSTYVLDGHGLVIFGISGRVADWPEYEPQLRHALTSLKK